jgi:DNA-binding CsgD family transcriptional regulator
MSKSSLLRIADVKSLYQLVGECRELGDDPHQWRRRWFGRLAELTGAELVVGGEAVQTGAAPLAFTYAVEWGWENGLDREKWIEVNVEHGGNVTSLPQFAAYFARAGNGDALSRKDLLADREWYRHWAYQDAFAGIGVDHSIVSFIRLSGGDDEYSALTLGRTLDVKADFSQRVKALVQESHAMLAPLIGGPLARFSEPSPSDLTPRVRQVLKCLLEGDGDKQIAARLGISPLTVNVHLKAIYLHFGVRGRSELMARWLRRGWGSKMTWADVE